MRRIVIFGRGGAGKTTLASRLSEALGVPTAELDALYWRDDATAIPTSAWVTLQEELLAQDRWILDGDLGPTDVVAPRLRAADTIIILDPPAYLCVWRALRRSREGPDFWRWMASWRRRSLPALMQAIERQATDASVVRLRSTRDIDDFLAQADGSPQTG